MVYDKILELGLKKAFAIDLINSNAILKAYHDERLSKGFVPRQCLSFYFL